MPGAAGYQFEQQIPWVQSLGISYHVGEDGIERCRIVFKPKIIPVRPGPRRAFQGWRYLEEADAPPDLPKMQKVDGLSEKMRRELAELGLL